MMHAAAWLPLLFQTKAPARTLGPRKGQWRVRQCPLPASHSLPTQASSPPLLEDDDISLLSLPDTGFGDGCPVGYLNWEEVYRPVF